MRQRSLILTVLALFSLLTGVSGAGASPVTPSAGANDPSAPTSSLGTSFTYQGQLKNGNSPVTASCGMAFRLYDDPTTGAQVGQVITTTVSVAGGLFTVHSTSAPAPSTAMRAGWTYG